MIRLLIVDDSTLMRRMIASIFKEYPDIEIVGFAQDGEEAVVKAQELRPDVITMDVEMPKMGGLTALRKILEIMSVPIVMVSSLTSQGAITTIEALEIGAVDFVCKPDGGAVNAIKKVEVELVNKVRAATKAKVQSAAFKPPKSNFRAVQSDRVLLVASSTGGPRALCALFQGLTQGLQIPILIVQHMPPGFTAGLAKRLDSIGTMPCKEAQPGDRVVAGQALMAPAGTHMKIRPDHTLEFTLEPTVHGVRPAADFLFQTGAEVFGANTVGAILTGMGRDGAEGARAIRRHGGIVFAESEASCTVYGMPRAAVVAGAVDYELSIDAMGEAISATVNTKRRLVRAS